MILRCLWNTCEGHDQTPLVSTEFSQGTSALTLSRALFTLLSLVTGLSFLQPAKQWHWLCPVNYLRLNAQPWVVCSSPRTTLWLSFSLRESHLFYLGFGTLSYKNSVVIFMMPIDVTTWSVRCCAMLKAHASCRLKTKHLYIYTHISHITI